MVPPTVPWWGRLSSLLAPILLIGGWTLAASLQPGGFDSVRLTISALAAEDAASRWVMTAAIAGTGICHLLTAAALRPAAPAGRWLLALGGAATIVVAVFPLPSSSGKSAAHGAAALAAFVLLSVWPLWSPRATARPPVPWGLRRPVARTAAVVLLAGAVAFGLSSTQGWTTSGLVERLTAGAQALWPLVVVASVPRRR